MGLGVVYGTFLYVGMTPLKASWIHLPFPQHKKGHNPNVYDTEPIWIPILSFNPRWYLTKSVNLEPHYFR